ncbi:MAG: hypothetical protein PF795_03015 [Kiritimatiellae bacterium]|nr:hypothetical protein [Kiritimatiellia bacterium]
MILFSLFLCLMMGLLIQSQLRNRMISMSRQGIFAGIPRDGAWGGLFWLVIAAEVGLVVWVIIEVSG